MSDKLLKRVGLILLLTLSVYYVLFKEVRIENKVEEISASDFLNMIESTKDVKPIGRLIITDKYESKKQITVDKNVIEGWFEDAKDKQVKPFKAIVDPLKTDVLEKLKKANLTYVTKSTEKKGFLGTITAIIPWLLIVGVVFLIVKRGIFNRSK